jgi:geranylgeranyl diphosphate synthase, type I
MSSDSGPARVLPGFFISYREAVEAELREIIKENPSALNNLIRYHMGWQDENGQPHKRKGGKFIRSTLSLLGCQSVGGEVSQALPAAAALELIHNFSLIHDDIEDASYERHQQPTVWKLWGQSQAMNAGDATFTLAYLALLRLREQGIAYEKIMHCIRVITEACVDLCEGQYLDIEFERQLDVPVDDYLHMIRKKTAALMATSVYLGAYLGTEDKKLLNSLYRFGEQLGMAYQIRDDILGIWGKKENTGKRIAEDILQRKKTLPVIYGLKHSRVEEVKKLKNLYSQEHIQHDDVAEIVEILDRLGARDYAQRLSEQYHEQASAQLEATALDHGRLALLRQAASFFLERDY